MINPIFVVAGTFLALNEKMGSLIGYNCGYDTMLYLKKKLVFEKNQAKKVKNRYQEHYYTKLGLKRLISEVRPEVLQNLRNQQAR